MWVKQISIKAAILLQVVSLNANWLLNKTGHSLFFLLPIVIVRWAYIKPTVDGKWTPWSPWQPCSVTCLIGYQERYRFCSDPSPSNGGSPCNGADTDRRQCDQGPCPGTSSDLSATVVLWSDSEHLICFYDCSFIDFLLHSIILCYQYDYASSLFVIY